MTRSFIWLDVFTDHPYSGNPLAVFPDAAGLSDAQMAQIARELNLSETTFVFPSDDPAATHRVRILTPTRELPFAGHPTVGTAVALALAASERSAQGAGGISDEFDFVFALRAGLTPVSVRRLADGSMEAALVAPQPPRLSASPIDTAALAEAIGLTAGDLDASVPVHLSDSGGTVFLMTVVNSMDALRRCHLERPLPDVVGVYIACRTDGGWRSRMFAPEAGVVEDPATGSATCSFAGTLHGFVDGYATDGTHEVVLRQGVEMGRPSALFLSFDVLEGAISEVRLRGGAVVVLRGELEVPPG